MSSHWIESQCKHRIQGHRNANVRAVRPGPTRSFHRCNDNQTPIITIAILFGRERRWNYDHRTPITRPKPSTQGYKRTSCSSMVNEFVHRCNQDKRAPIISIMIYVGGERRWNYGRRTPITRLKSIAQKYTRTCCSSGTSEIVNWCNHDNQTPIVTIVIYFDRERRWNYDHRTPITWRKSNTQEYKLTHCSPRTNELRPSMQPR